MADTGVVGPEGGMEGKGPDTELEDAQKEMLLGLQDAQKQVKDSLDYAQGQAAGGVDKAKDAMGMGEPTVSIRHSSQHLALCIHIMHTMRKSIQLFFRECIHFKKFQVSIFHTHNSSSRATAVVMSTSHRTPVLTPDRATCFNR